MGHLDINVGKLKKNAFRYSKVRGETASRIRIPGGVIDAKSLAKAVEIAEKYGNGVINITNRQGLEIPGIDLRDMDKVNEELQSIIEALNINQTQSGAGYPSSGTRNIIACPGARLCPFGCYDTTAMARQCEKLIFPNDRHVKIAFTGCSNDCAKVRMADFGVIGMTVAGQRQGDARRREVHRLRRVRGLLPHPGLDAKPRALFPHCSSWPHRQAQSAPGGGFHQVVR